MNLPPSSSSPILFSRLTITPFSACFSSIARHLVPMRLRFRSFSTRHRKNFYKVLDIPQTASQADIKKAYYTMSKKYHPDVTGSNASCAQKYLEIKEAYDILRDEKQRAEHDRWLGTEKAQRQRTIDGRDPFESNQKVYNEWRTAYNGTSVEEELQRIWRSMNGNDEFRQSHRDFEAAVRRKRQMAYEEQMRRRKEWMHNGFGNHREGDWTRQNSHKIIGKIILLYVLITILIEIFYSATNRYYYKGPTISQPHRDEEIRKWIEERMRKMP